MKVIIISDIQGQAKSIIPYGLRMGRSLEAEVDILHTIDSRKTHGKSSPYADSQSMTPGEKLPHEKIIRREMNQAHNALQKYISGEGSRLNYPLKINMVIESNTLQNSINKMIDDHPDSIIIASFLPNNSMVDALDELLSIMMKLNIPTFFIPPEHPFKELRSCMLFTDFSPGSYESLKQLNGWLKSFDPLMIHAFGMTGKKDRATAVEISTRWKRKALEFIESPINLKTTMIGNGDSYQQFAEYILRNKTELVLLPRYMIRNGSGTQLSTGLFKKALKDIALPIAIY